METRTVSIRPGVSVLSVLRHLNYKPWFAMAEFVETTPCRASLLTVRHLNPCMADIIGSACGSTLTHPLRQASLLGITPEECARSDFPRAFRPAAIPVDRSGLSEFGMGMKSAACWFAPRWSVRTKALGETVERTVRFDVEHIVHDQVEEITIEESPSDVNLHFTEIVLEDLHHVPVRRTVSKIKSTPCRYLQSVHS